MPNEILTMFAQQLVADGKRDREVLRRRWQVPSWRAEIERIADVLQRNPLLIPSVEKTINDELSRLAAESAPTTPITPFTETNSDADRQSTTLSGVQQEPTPQ